MVFVFDSEDFGYLPISTYTQLQYSDFLFGNC